MSFWDAHIYGTHTRSRFNMCNGTPLAGAPHQPDSSPSPGTKKIALDPAESSAIERQEPVGAGPAV